MKVVLLQNPVQAYILVKKGIKNKKKQGRYTEINSKITRQILNIYLRNITI